MASAKRPETPQKSSPGERLKAARATVPGLTQAILASKARLDAMVVSRIERGEQGLTRNNVAKLASVLGTSWLTDEERQLFADDLAVTPAQEPTDLPPFDLVKFDELYTTATRRVKDHYDAGPPSEPQSTLPRDETIAFYKEWLANLRLQDRQGMLRDLVRTNTPPTADESGTRTKAMQPSATRDPPKSRAK